MATREADGEPAWRGEAILFDMDGTLVDSRASVERQWRRWSARHGLDAEPIIAVAHGRRTFDTLRDVAPHLATPDEAERFDDEEAADDEGVVAVPGAAALLASLPANRWAVVTSARRGLAEARLAAAKLPVPAVLVSADQIERGKPDPEGYLLAARRLGVRPERCLVVEDTPAGIAAGENAGMQVLGVAQTYPPGALAAPIVVVDLVAVRATLSDSTLSIVVAGGRA